MSDLPASPDSFNRNPSPSFNVLTTSLKDNFKTFALLQKQESMISKVESNLQKTLELFRDQSGTVLPVSQQKENRASTPPNKYKLDKLESVESPNRKLQEEDLMVNYGSGQSSNKKSVNGSVSDNASPKLGSGSKRHVKLKMDDLSQKEVEGRSPVQVSKRYEKVLEEGEKQRSGKKLNSSSKKKNKSTSMSANKHQRDEMNSYQEEMSELKEDNKRLREALEHQTTKADTTINELERENYELRSRIDQSQDLFNSQSQIERDREELSDLPKFLVEQIIKDKNDLETRYNDLFVSYAILLEHNKALSQKIETLEKDKESKEIEKVVQDSFVERSFGNPEKNFEPNLSFKDQHNISLTQENSIGKIRKNKERDPTISNSLFYLLEEDKILTTGRKSLMESTLKEESLVKSTDQKNLMEELASEKKQIVNNKTKRSPIGRTVLGTKTNNEATVKIDKEKKPDVGVVCNTEGYEKENKPKFSLPIKRNLPPQKIKKEGDKDALPSTSRTKITLTQRSTQQETLMTSPRQAMKENYMSPNRDSQKLKQSIGSKKSPSGKENFASPQPKKQILYSRGVKRG